MTVPTGVSGATPIVPATNSTSLTPTSLPAQFIAAAQPIQPAPPLALLQVLYFLKFNPMVRQTT